MIKTKTQFLLFYLILGVVIMNNSARCCMSMD